MAASVSGAVRRAPDHFANLVWIAAILMGVAEAVAMFWLDL